MLKLQQILSDFGNRYAHRQLGQYHLFSTSVIG